MPRRALAIALVLAVAACGGDPPRAAPAAPPLLPVPPLGPGLRLTIAPNLPDVTADDLPETTQRVAEVVSVDGEKLTLWWSGRVRRETPASADRRATWLRARTAAGSGEIPPSPAAPEFVEAEVTGTLELPDFGSARAIVLPGLWPEGRTVLRGCSGLWLGAGAFAELVGTRRAAVSFLRARALKDPAAGLLDRATDIAEGKEGTEWRLLPEPGRSPLVVNGVAGEVATLRLASWFGTIEVLPDPKNPLVVSADPAPTSSGLLPLFAPARVLRMLLAYRVVALDAGTPASTAPGATP